MNLLEAISDEKLFAGWFRDRRTWDAWSTFIAALFGYPLEDNRLALYRTCTGRQTVPATPFKEAWLVIGRRGGKSFMLALLAVFLACFNNYAPFLAPGEYATILIIAADRRQARIILGYIGGLLRGVPMLARMVSTETKESFELSNRVRIEIATASFRSVRGFAIAACLCDELAFWRSDDSALPDFEVLRAIRPAMLTIPTSVLLCASSPYARRGALYEAFVKHFGKDDAPALVWRAPTLLMNPTVPKDEIDKEYELDPASAAAEYGAEFRTDVEAFVSREAVMACIEPGVRERPSERQWQYVAFVDPSGGSSDSMTCAIAHKEGKTVRLDLVREVKPPFSPETVVEEFSDILRRYRCIRVTGDRYGGEWCREQFRKRNIIYDLAEKPKSDIYRDFLPLVNSGAVDLLDDAKLINQIVGLERRTRAGGRDVIDHGPGGHDDLVNSAAGAVVLAVTKSLQRQPSDIRMEGGIGWNPITYTYKPFHGGN